MQVNVETDNHIENRERLIEHVDGVVRDAVDKHEERITFVEAHLGDMNSPTKSGAADMRCMLQAHIAGVKSVAVEHRAESLHMAIEGAAQKLTKALDSAIGKLESRERRSQGIGEASADIVATLDTAPVPIDEAGVQDGAADATRGGIAKS